MNNYDIKVGFSRVNITPPLGVNIRGYYKVRICDGVLDELESNTIAIEKNGKKVLLISVDNISLPDDTIEKIKDKIIELVKVERDAIFIHSTHTHTGPGVYANKTDSINDIDMLYSANTILKIAEGAVIALDDLKNACMSIAFSKAERIAFNRRYLMKDGSYKTNPGVNNPDIAKSAGVLDERVNVVRFDRENASTIVLVNFGNHPDTIGGNKISADWPGFTRRIVEKTLDNVNCVMFNGTEGDINHVNVHPVGGDFNGMFNDFDDVSRGYAHARHMGNVMASSVLNVYEKMLAIPVDSIAFKEEIVQIPSNMPKPEEMEEARYIDKMHNEGRDTELPYKGMWLTTMVAGAARKVKLEHGPETFPMNISIIKIGKVVFIGIPGEPFEGIGLGLKETEGFEMILPCCLTNGDKGYFPMKDTFDEGGYESASSRYKAGVAEFIIEEGKKIIKKLK